MIRAASHNDLREIQELFRGSVLNVCSRDYTEAQTAVWSAGSKNAEKWYNGISNQYFVLDVRSCGVAGFASLKQSEIDLLYVHHKCQGQGIGKGLITHLENYARDHNVHEMVAFSSITARPFFEKLGFKTLLQQTVVLNSINLINYKMLKSLIT